VVLRCFSDSEALDGYAAGMAVAGMKSFADKQSF
jgi:hypothetical protein